MIKYVDFENGCLEHFYSKISKNIIRIRKANNISQLKLANAIGHQSPTFVGKAELLAENKHFNLEHIYKISQVLDVPICEFFKDVDDVVDELGDE